MTTDVTPGDDSLKVVAELAAKQVQLEKEIEDLEAQLKEQDIKKDIMASNGIDVVTS